MLAPFAQIGKHYPVAAVIETQLLVASHIYLVVKPQTQLFNLVAIQSVKHLPVPSISDRTQVVVAEHNKLFTPQKQSLSPPTQFDLHEPAVAIADAQY